MTSPKADEVTDEQANAAIMEAAMTIYRISKDRQWWGFAELADNIYRLAAADEQ